jgi:predicted dehydrogenase
MDRATMSAQIRWGILGTGFAAAQFVDGLRTLENTWVSAVASRTTARAEEFARHFSIPTSYGRYEDLFADPAVDVVYVATTNPQHRAHCLLAIEAGKAVVCEKPFALDGAQAREIVDAARRRKVFCMEAIRPRFLPAVREMHRLVAEGAIGEPQALYAALGHRSIVDPANRLLDPIGGGALLDIGCYPLSIAVLLFGRPAGVKSSAVMDASRIDHEWSAILSYTGGRTATISATLRADLSPSLVVTGSAGTIEMNGPLYWGETLSIRRNPPTAPQAVNTSAGFPPRGLATRVKSIPAVRLTISRIKSLLRPLRRSAQVITCPYPGNGFTAEAHEAIECLRENRIESRLSPLDDSVAMMDIMDSIRRHWSVE